MKKLLIALALVCIPITGASAKQYSFLVEMEQEFATGAVVVQTVKLAEGEAPQEARGIRNPYVLQLVSSADDVLYVRRFAFPDGIDFAPPPREWFDDQGNQIRSERDTTETDSRPTKAPVSLAVPYLASATKVVVLDSNGVVVARRQIPSTETLIRAHIEDQAPVASTVASGFSFSLSQGAVSGLVVLAVLLLLAVYAHRTGKTRVQ